MKICALAHAAYYVKDLDRSMDFYVNKLGFLKKFSLTWGDLTETLLNLLPCEHKEAMTVVLNSKKNRVAQVVLEIAPKQYIELFDAADQPIPPAASGMEIGYHHLSLEAEDIFVAYHDLVEQGVVATEPIYGIEGTYQFWIADPDGNRIEINQYTAKSRQIIG